MAVENTNEEIVKKIQAGQDDFWDMLIRENMGLVNSLVSSMSAYNHLNEYDRKELQQIGMIKIMEAAKQFNGSANTKFSTFAHIRIRYGLIDWLRDNKSMIHIPDEMRKKCSLYKEAIENFAKQNDGNIPSDRLLIKQLRISEEELIIIRDTLRAFEVDSLDVPKENMDEKIAIVDTIVDNEDKYMEVFFREDKSRMFQLILKLKNEKERRVIVDEFYNDIMKVDIAKDMGCSKQRVQTLKRDAIKHLRELPEIMEMAKEFGITIENK